MSGIRDLLAPGYSLVFLIGKCEAPRPPNLTGNVALICYNLLLRAYWGKQRRGQMRPLRTPQRCCWRGESLPITRRLLGRDERVITVLAPYEQPWQAAGWRDLYLDVMPLAVVDEVGRTVTNGILMSQL